MGGLIPKANTATPKVEAAAPMPDQQQTTKAKRRQIARDGKTQGAQSTLLSTGGRETLGA